METDRVLLDAAKSMDETAFAKIFDLYAYAIYKYALRLCNDSLLADQIVEMYSRSFWTSFRAETGHGLTYDPISLKQPIISLSTRSATQFEASSGTG